MDNKKHRNALLQYKGGICRICGKRLADILASYGEKAGCVFDFHHINPETKASDYKKLMQRKLCPTQLDELDKCVLLCAVCHDLVHAQDHTAEMEISIEIEGRHASQKIRGAVLINHSAKCFQFVSNERILVIPYRVRVGRQKPKLVFGTQLSQEDFFFNTYLKKLPQHRKISISTWIGDEPIFKAKYKGSGWFDAFFDERCPIIEADFRGETVVYTRPDVTITDTLDVLRAYTVNFEARLPV